MIINYQLEIEVDVSFEPYQPAIIARDPNDSYPEEGGGIEDISGEIVLDRTKRIYNKDNKYVRTEVTKKMRVKLSDEILEALSVDPDFLDEAGQHIAEYEQSLKEDAQIAKGEEY